MTIYAWRIAVSTIRKGLGYISGNCSSSIYSILPNLSLIRLANRDASGSMITTRFRTKTYFDQLTRRHYLIGNLKKLEFVLIRKHTLINVRGVCQTCLLCFKGSDMSTT